MLRIKKHAEEEHKEKGEAKIDDNIRHTNKEMDKIKRETEDAVQNEKKRADAATDRANHKQIEAAREAAEVKER